MQLKWLEDFIAYAETRSVTRAADIRHVTHPAFSRRLKALEQSLGVSLIDRGSFPAALTAEGERFLEVAILVKTELSDVRDELRKRRANSEHTLTIATGRTLARTVFPDIYRKLATVRPPLQVILHTTTVNDGISLLINESVDAFVCYATPSITLELDKNDYMSASLGLDHLVAVSSIDGHGKPLFAVPAPGDKPVRFLAYAETMALGRTLSAALARRRVLASLKPVFQSDMSETIHDLVRQGAGLAWLPMRLIAEDLAAKRLVRADQPEFDIDIEIKVYGRAGRRGVQSKIWRAIIASLKDTPSAEAS